MEYEVKNEKPPIWEEAHKHFKIDDRVTFYTYGYCIYNPAGIKLPDHIIEHEIIHMTQQDVHPGGPAGWWKQYFADAQFRHDQELAGYRHQYKFYKDHHSNRRKREWFLEQIATHLSSPMYGVGITKEQAMEEITANNY